MSTELPDWARRLRELRTANLLNLEEAAVKCGVSPRSLSTWENGRAPAMVHKRRKVLEAYGVEFARHREFFGPLARD